MNDISPLVRATELDEEDSSYVLRELERNAFTSVVQAMRAQGVFTVAKEVVLESISDEIYKAEIRRAANDEFLTKVASLLNPSYDVHTEWGMVGREVEEDRPFFPPVKYFEENGATTSSISLADRLLKQATSHNDVIADQDIITINLLQLPKAPFVPERLRKLLVDSESLSSERIITRDDDPEEDLVVTRVVSPRKPSIKPAIMMKRKRKAKINGARDTPYEEPNINLFITEKPSTSTAPTPPPPSKSHETTSALLNLLPSKESETLGVKEFISKIQAQIEQEQRNGLLAENSKRKRKPRISATVKEVFPDCARARPFVFGRPHSDGTKPPRGNPDRLPLKRSATPATSPIMVPPVTPPNTNGHQAGSIHVQVIPPVTLPQAYSHENRVLSPNHQPSTSHDSIPHKENNSIPMRPLLSSASLPLNHVITKPSVPSVSPVTTPTGIIKRPRVGSFNEPNKLPTSPIDLTHRPTAVRKTTYLQPSPTANKVKGPIELHGQTMTVLPNTKPIFTQPMAVTVNRAQSRIVSNETGKIISPQLVQRTLSTSTQQQAPNSITVHELHGHDYSAPIPKTAVIKKAVISAPVGSPVRIMNGSSVSHKNPSVVHPSVLTHPAQAIVSQQVIVKKTNAPALSLTASSPAPLVSVVHRPSPPPNANSTQQTIALRKYVTTGALPSAAGSIPMSHFIKMNKVSTSNSSTGEAGPPPVKRFIYCDPNNPTLATIQSSDSTPEKERIIVRTNLERPTIKVTVGVTKEDVRQQPSTSVPTPSPQKSVDTIQRVSISPADPPRKTNPPPPFQPTPPTVSKSLEQSSPPSSERPIQPPIVEIT